MAQQSTATTEQHSRSTGGPEASQRQYLRITPTDTAVNPEAIHSQFCRLHEFAWQATERDWQGRLTRRLVGNGRTPQTLEWLLVTDGTSDQPLRYYLGIETAATKVKPESAQGHESGHPHADWDHDGVRRVLQSMLPNDYHVEAVRWHPREVLGGTPDVREEADTTSEDATAADIVEPDDEHEREQEATAPPTETPHYEAVEFVGQTTHRKDWQTRLTPLDAWLDAAVEARPPLAELIETLAESPVPMVYQVLLRPMASWTGTAADRRYDLLEGRDTLATRVARDLGLGSDTIGTKRREQLDRRRTDDENPLESGSATTTSPVERVRAIESRDTDHSFVVTARLVSRGTREVTDGRCGHLTGVFSTASGPYHRIQGVHSTGDDAEQLCDALCDRRHAAQEYERRRTAIPGITPTSRGIVADAREAPVFCLLDGGSLTPTAMRGLAPTPGERARPRGPPPARDRLSRYRGGGLTLGQFEPGWTTGLDSDGVGYHAGSREQGPGQGDSFTVRLPPDLQRLHIAWFGKTGSGKTTAATVGLLENHFETDGATIVIDQKGDGMADELSRIQYAVEGSLEGIHYFDCTQTLPALSFFDIRDQLAAGVTRDVAVADVAAHYAEILAQLHADYHAAGVSVKVIEAVVKALFDPVHGRNAFTHREFRSLLSWMAEHQSAPAVSDPQLERVLTDAVTGPRREFTNIMTGVTNRVDEVTLQTQLERVLNHVWSTPPGDTGHPPTAGEPANEEAPTADESVATQPDPAFDFVDMLDENVIVVFDMGGLREEAQRAMTLLVLSSLWTALRRRVHRRQQLYGRRGGDGHTPEASATAEVEASADAEGWADGQPDEIDRRGGRTDVGHAETSQRDHPVADSTTAAETGADDLPLVNLHVEEASRVAVSGVFSDLLAQARSFGCSVTLSMQYPAQLKHADPEAYDEVLNNVSTVVTGNVPLDRDLAARLATEDMEPQEVANRLRALSRGEWLCALPAAFGDAEPRPFVITSVPLPPGHPEGPHPLSADQELHFEIATVRRDSRTRDQYGLTLTQPSTVDTEGAETETTDADDETAEPTDAERRARVDSALPYTRRLPETVTYAPARHALDCTVCESRYDPSDAGMRRAIACCSSLEAVDPDDIPVTAVNLKLTREERVDTGYTDTQLMLLQVVYNAQQLRYDAPAYDILTDSMIRLLEYVGATNEDVEELIEAGYLTHDTDHPHRLYSVTPAGRTVLGEHFREGVDYGHGQGDLEETSAHVLMVEAARRYLLQAFVEDPASPVTQVVPYYEIDEHRLDLAGLDDEENVVVAVEAERVNHDIGRAVPSDYDKMAACEPDAAIWVVMTTAAAHDVLEALHDPLDGEPRLDKSFSRTTMPWEIAFDEPGLTDIYPITQLLARLE